jgi:hypothetical protein
MIQRIQTLWLFLASLTLFSLFIFPYSHFSDQTGIAHALKITGLYKNIGGQAVLSTSFILQTIGLVILAIFPFIIIFFYKNRKKQSLFVSILIALIILFGTWLYVSSQKAIEAVNQQISIGNLDIGALLIPLSIIFLFLALKGIRHDEKLIKSAERLR